MWLTEDGDHGCGWCGERVYDLRDAAYDRLMARLEKGFRDSAREKRRREEKLGA